MMINKKLFRPKKGRVLFGVGQGLGEYFNIDPVIIRILFVIVTIWGGAGIILYIIGILLIPDEKSENLKEEINNLGKNCCNDKNNKKSAEVIEEKVSVKSQTNSNIVIGLIIILLGLLFLFSNFVPWLSLIKLWPVILIFIGVIIIGDTFKDKL